MSKIKELWWMAKQLFTKIDKDRVEYKQMEHYPYTGYAAMSWCGYLLTKKDKDKIVPRTWNHENIHLMQAKDKGSWLKYYWSYLVQWLKGNPLIHPASAAYYTNCYEMEAYANAENLDYLNTRKSEDLNKYKIKNRKKTYKKYGYYGFMDYIKSL